MQGCLNCRKPNDGKKYIYVDDGKKAEVEVITKFRLLLKTRFYLDLDETLLFRLFDGIWFPFLLWTNLDFLVHLEMKILICFMIQN